MFYHTEDALEAIADRLESRLEQIADSDTLERKYERYCIRECLIAVSQQLDSLTDEECGLREIMEGIRSSSQEFMKEWIIHLRTNYQSIIDELGIRYSDPKEFDWDMVQHGCAMNLVFWPDWAPEYIECLAGHVSLPRLRELAADAEPTSEERGAYDTSYVIARLYEGHYECKVHISMVRMHSGAVGHVVGIIDGNYTFMDHVGPFSSMDDATKFIKTFGFTDEWRIAGDTDKPDDMGEEEDNEDD